MFVCLCKSITDHQINDAVENGVTTFEAMQSHLDVSSVCGACTCEVKDIISKKLKAELSSRTVVRAKQITFPTYS